VRRHYGDMSDNTIPEPRRPTGAALATSSLATPAQPIMAQALIGLCLSGHLGIVYHLRERELPLDVRLAVLDFLARANAREHTALKRSYNKRGWMTELPS